MGRPCSRGITHAFFFAEARCLNTVADIKEIKAVDALKPRSGSGQRDQQMPNASIWSADAERKLWSGDNNAPLFQGAAEQKSKPK